MAKQENFKISFNGKEIIKHKWNSSIRETEFLIGEIAKSEKTIYKLVNSESIKEGFGFVKGFREWEGITAKLSALLLKNNNKRIADTKPPCAALFLIKELIMKIEQTCHCGKVLAKAADVKRGINLKLENFGSALD